MKQKGEIRYIDKLGRLSLPAKVRSELDIGVNDSVEICMEDEYIILRKYEPVCSLCGENGNIITFKNRNICRSCLCNIALRYPFQ